jgi:hypothetical protein
LQFIGREKAVSTASFQYRFGFYDIRDARKVLNDLCALGLVSKEREIFDIGAMNGWRLTDKGRAIVDSTPDRA